MYAGWVIKVAVSSFFPPPPEVTCRPLRLEQVPARSPRRTCMKFPRGDPMTKEGGKRRRKKVRTEAEKKPSAHENNWMQKKENEGLEPPAPSIIDIRCSALTAPNQDQNTPSIRTCVVVWRDGQAAGVRGSR